MKKLLFCVLCFLMSACSSQTTYKVPAYYSVNQVPESFEFGKTYQVNSLRQAKGKQILPQSYKGMALRDYPERSYFE